MHSYVNYGRFQWRESVQLRKVSLPRGAWEIDSVLHHLAHTLKSLTKFWLLFSFCSRPVSTVFLSESVINYSINLYASNPSQKEKHYKLTLKSSNLLCAFKKWSKKLPQWSQYSGRNACSISGRPSSKPHQSVLVKVKSKSFKQIYLVWINFLKLDLLLKSLIRDMHEFAHASRIKLKYFSTLAQMARASTYETQTLAFVDT